MPHDTIRPVLILALLLVAGCSSVANLSDKLVGGGNRYQSDQTKQAADNSGLSMPPDLNARPNLPPPQYAQTQPQYAQPQLPPQQYGQGQAQYAQQPQPQPQPQPQYAQPQMPAQQYAPPQGQYAQPQTPPQQYAQPQMAAAQTQLQTKPTQILTPQASMPQTPMPLAAGQAAPAQFVTQSAGLPGPGSSGLSDPNTDNYLIGPGDELDIFVWRNSDLSTKVPVRPDGKISIPLVDDVVAVGKTPSMLSRELEDKLKVFVKDPIVTVIVSNFVGPFSQQVRVIGEATQPRAIPYRANMTMLDVMIEVGGLTRFAAGDRSVVVRNFQGHQETIHAKLDGLVQDGDVGDNIQMRPGDIVIIPQRYF